MRGVNRPKAILSLCRVQVKGLLARIHCVPVIPCTEQFPKLRLAKAFLLSKRSNCSGLRGFDCGKVLPYLAAIVLSSSTARRFRGK